MTGHPRRSRGFTLLELLVALAVFAILAALAYGGLNAILQTRAETERQAARLAELQSALTLLARDLNQAAPRAVRSEYGDVLPALRGGPLAPLPLELTRGGWGNRVGHARSTLQRVGYAVEDEVLVRHSWRVLDRAQDSTAYPLKVLTGVRRFQVRFMDEGRQWLDDWPPGVLPTQNAQAVQPRLLAVEVQIELEDLGEIRRLLPVPG
ncbi:MAG: type II secretion system minor pseudopilin GspJ [Gammaproteobacteria bacterium]|nr:type II secretion system minor pseudopilin GspJ [Gammaproteobacteria bacterium]